MTKENQSEQRALLQGAAENCPVQHTCGSEPESRSGEEDRSRRPQPLGNTPHRDLGGSTRPLLEGALRPLFFCLKNCRRHKPGRPQYPSRTGVWAVKLRGAVRGLQTPVSSQRGYNTGETCTPHPAANLSLRAVIISESALARSCGQRSRTPSRLYRFTG